MQVYWYNRLLEAERQRAYVLTKLMDIDRLFSKKIVLIYATPISLVLHTLLRFPSLYVLTNAQS